MTNAWKFSIDYTAIPEFTNEEVRAIVAAVACEAEGGIVLTDDDVFLMRFEDAYAFRMRAGHLVEGGAKTHLTA